ncbi:MAG: D-ribose pyranase [Rhodobacteraceae bacterium]|nr:D-ribose pyranase [Paracoccaceae bacterium]
MKQAGVLQRDINALIGRLGHLDEIVICDAGLPIPEEIPVIDLALRPGMVPFIEVLEVLRGEIVIEGAVWAEEASAELDATLRAAMAAWASTGGQGVSVTQVPHDAFKTRSQKARAVIRTGEATPYANVILICGVAF